MPEGCFDGFGSVDASGTVEDVEPFSLCERCSVEQPLSPGTIRQNSIRINPDILCTQSLHGSQVDRDRLPRKSPKGIQFPFCPFKQFSCGLAKALVQKIPQNRESTFTCIIIQGQLVQSIACFRHCGEVNQHRQLAIVEPIQSLLGLHSFLPLEVSLAISSKGLNAHTAYAAFGTFTVPCPPAQERPQLRCPGRR